MVFADEIALGDFTSVDLDDLVAKDDYSGRGQRASKTFSEFQLGFAVSAILHFALASALFYFVASDITTVEELVLASIKVEFVPFNPLLIQAEESIPETSSQNAAPIPLTGSSSTLSVAESQPESNQKDVPEIGEFEIMEAPPAESSIANSLPLPRILDAALAFFMGCTICAAAGRFACILRTLFGRCL